MHDTSTLSCLTDKKNVTHLNFAIIIVFILTAAYGCSGKYGLFGPGPFEVVEADTRFSNQKGPILMSRNNRISTKSITGGVHIDDSGVFINPTVMKAKDTGEIISLWLSIFNKTFYDTKFGGSNTLGVMSNITFLLNNNQTISLPIKNGDVSWGDKAQYNNVSKSASSTIIESGTAFISVNQYHDIVAADSLAVQIQGSKRSVTYEFQDISASFLNNLKMFFSEYVKQEE
ncbi:MAG: hypothetical protein RBT11_01815 [Desulfobacterales bacterium]|jgi:hypothetical protein|nr:hypothetical protein [Desulfobacterales bacterium]